MRSLASIRKISDILPINGADFLELLVIDGWQVVGKKGEFKVGDFCVYFEIDSFLPIEDRYEFLRTRSYKKYKDGREGFRIKTAKLRGELSQGLALPMFEFPELVNLNYNEMIESNTADVTDLLKVVLYEPDITFVSGTQAGHFPSMIEKTDEERIQNLNLESINDFLIQHSQNTYITEKVDGCSSTYFYLNGKFGLCSRNFELKWDESVSDTYSEIAKKYNFENTLKDVGITSGIVIQGEIIGPGIQGNHYKLNETEFRLYNVIFYEPGLPPLRGCYQDLVRTAEKLNIKMVPVLHEPGAYVFKLDSMLNFVNELKSAINPEVSAEGIVIRSEFSNLTHRLKKQPPKRISFKVISNEYLLKHEN